MSRKIQYRQKEIEDVRSRLRDQKWDHLSFDINSRLDSLRPLIGSKMGAELHRHVVVSSIAALQTFHRSIIVSLVDSAQEYRERVAELLTEKVSLKEALTWLGGQSVTFGELVAHHAPCNNVNDMLTWLGAILDCDMKRALSEAISPWDRDKDTQEVEKLVPDIKLLLNQLGNAFKLRHIFAHEAAPDIDIMVDECKLMHDAISIWIKGVDAVVWSIAYKDVPLTTYDMNMHADNEIREAVKALEKAMSRAIIFAKSEEKEDWLIENHKAWLQNTKDWTHGAYWSQEGTMWRSVGGHDFAQAILTRAERVANFVCDPDISDGDGTTPLDKGGWWGLQERES